MSRQPTESPTYDQQLQRLLRQGKARQYIPSDSNFPQSLPYSERYGNILNTIFAEYAPTASAKPSTEQQDANTNDPTECPREKFLQHNERVKAWKNTGSPRENAKNEWRYSILSLIIGSIVEIKADIKNFQGNPETYSSTLDDLVIDRTVQVLSHIIRSHVTDSIPAYVTTACNNLIKDAVRFASKDRSLPVSQMGPDDSEISTQDLLESYAYQRSSALPGSSHQVPLDGDSIKKNFQSIIDATRQKFKLPETGNAALLFSIAATALFPATLSYQQIRYHTQLTIGTVKSRLMRLKREPAFISACAALVEAFTDTNHRMENVFWAWASEEHNVYPIQNDDTIKTKIQTPITSPEALVALIAPSILPHVKKDADIKTALINSIKYCFGLCQRNTLLLDVTPTGRTLVNESWNKHSVDRDTHISGEDLAPALEEAINSFVASRVTPAHEALTAKIPEIIEAATKIAEKNDSITMQLVATCLVMGVNRIPLSEDHTKDNIKEARIAIREEKQSENPLPTTPIDLSLIPIEKRLNLLNRALSGAAR